MRLFWNDCKRSILSWGFLAAVLGTCAVYFAGAWVDLQWGVNDVLYYYSVASRLGDYTKLLPVLCVLPFATSYATEWNHHFVPYAVVRSNQTKYAISKGLATALSGGLALAMGLALFLGLLAWRFPLADMEGAGFDIAPTGGYHALLQSQQFVLYYFFHVIQLFCVGAFWATIALVVSAYLPNVTVTASSAFILYYFLRVLFLKVHIPNYLNVTTLYQGAFRLTASAWLNLLFVVGYFSVLTGLAIFLFVQSSQRRLAHA